jgi:hypothetical protein
MHIRKWFAGAVLVFAMTLALGVYAWASDEVGYISGTNVNLRSEGNMDSKVITKMDYGTSVTILSKFGEWYKVIHNGTSGYVFEEYITLGEKPPLDKNGDVELVDWWTEGQGIMTKGTIAKVTDVATGISYRVRVIFGTNHADVEPLTAEDTAKKLQTRGGKWSWDSRAVWLTLENGRTIAASVNGVPHGRSSIKDNDFPGHFCIHFLNSFNHGRTRVNESHQKQIRIAFESA